MMIATSTFDTRLNCSPFLMMPFFLFFSRSRSFLISSWVNSVAIAILTMLFRTAKVLRHLYPTGRTLYNVPL
jgi:hypothetical protein